MKVKRKRVGWVRSVKSLGYIIPFEGEKATCKSEGKA